MQWRHTHALTAELRLGMYTARMRHTTYEWLNWSTRVEKALGSSHGVGCCAYTAPSSASRIHPAITPAFVLLLCQNGCVCVAGCGRVVKASNIRPTPTPKHQGGKQHTNTLTSAHHHCNQHSTTTPHTPLRCLRSKILCCLLCNRDFGPAPLVDFAPGRAAEWSNDTTWSE